MDRPAELKWPSISGSRQNFVDANCVLSMLCLQQRDENPEDEEFQHSISALDEVDESDGEEMELVDPGKAELHHEKQSQLALANLRNRFLDRLAEVLAWVRRPPEAVKQISSGYLAESEDQASMQHAHISLAKNEGLNANDHDYLEDLCNTLMQIARGGELADLRGRLSKQSVDLKSVFIERSFSEAREALLTDTLGYARPRVDYYLEILRKEFNRKAHARTTNSSEIGDHLAS